MPGFIAPENEVEKPVSSGGFIAPDHEIVKKKELSGSDSANPGKPSTSSGQDSQTGTAEVGLTKGGQKAPQETEAQRRAKYPTGTYLQKEVAPTKITEAAPPSKPTEKDKSNENILDKVGDGVKEFARTVTTSAQQGWNQGEQAAKLDEVRGAKMAKDLSKESGDAYDKIYDQKVEELNHITDHLSKIESSESVKEYENAEGISGKWEAFKKNPADILTNIVIRSASALASNTLNSQGQSGGDLIGNALEIPSPTQAMLVAEKGYKLGMASDMMGALQESKIDLKDPESVKEAFNNKDKIEEIYQNAQKRNIPIALVDAVTGSIAGAVVKSLAKKSILKQAASGFGIEVAGGGVSETLGQLNEKGEIYDPVAVVEEMAGEVGSGAPNVITSLVPKAKNSDAKPVYKDQNGGQVPNETQQQIPGNSGKDVSNESDKPGLQPVNPEANQRIDESLAKQELPAGVQDGPTTQEAAILPTTTEHIAETVKNNSLEEAARQINEDTGLAQRRIDEQHELDNTKGNDISMADSETPSAGSTEPAVSSNGDSQSENDESNEGGVRKKSVINRAYKGQTETQIREAIEKYGLTYEVESHLAAEEIADGIISDIGLENALEATRRYKIQGAPAAFVLSKGIDSLQESILSETDPVTLEQLVNDQSELINQLDVIGRTGGRFASALQAIYDKSDFNFDFERQVKQYKEANNGIIPKEIEDKMRNLDNQLKEASQKYKEAEEKVKKLEEQAAVDNIKKDIEQKSPDKKKRKGKILISEGVNELAEALGITLMAAGDQKASVTKALVKIGRGMIEEGIATVDTVAEKLKQFVSEKFQGKIDYDQYNEDVYSEITSEPTSGGKVKVKQSLIRQLIEEGAHDIDTLVKDVKTHIKSEYPDATERDIRDAITAYGRTINPSKDEIEIKLGKMKRIGRLISALEDVRAKKRPLKSGQQREKADADERALSKELREAMKELPMDQEVLDRQLKTAMDATKQRLKNQIEDLNREIASKEKTPESVKVFRDDEELLDLKKTRDELKKQHDEIFKDEDFILGKKIEIAKRNAEKKIADFQKRIAERDYAKRPRARFEADRELNTLRIKQLEIKDEFTKLQYENELKNRTKTQKAIDGLFEAWGLTRALRATGEASFILLQGGIQTVSHPEHALKAFKTAISHFASETKSENWLRELRTKDVYQRMKESRLALAEPNAKLTVREEQFLGGWVNHIWDFGGYPLKLVGDKTYEFWKKVNPIKMIERAGVGYMNTLRAERYLQGEKMLQMQGKSIIKDKEDFKNMADVINTLTGRASIGALEGSSKVWSSIFFSPRNWASTIKTATPYAFYHFGKMTTKDALGRTKVSVAQKMAMADFMKFVGITGSLVMLAAVKSNDDNDKETGVEFDPTSSDFMKIKIGDTRIDPWGGKIQHIVLQARLIAQSMKKADGKSYTLGKGNTSTSWDLLQKTATNKLAPSMAMFYKYATTKVKNVNGKEVRYSPFTGEYNATDELSGNIYPIYWDSVREIYKDQPETVATFLSVMAFMGLGVNAYDSSKKKKK